MNTPRKIVVPFDLVREDGRLEKTCEHGVGHTVGHLRGYLKEAESIHGCDGCCKDYELQEEQEERPDYPLDRGDS